MTRTSPRANLPSISLNLSIRVSVSKRERRTECRLRCTQQAANVKCHAVSEYYIPLPQRSWNPSGFQGYYPRCLQRGRCFVKTVQNEVCGGLAGCEHWQGIRSSCSSSVNIHESDSASDGEDKGDTAFTGHSLDRSAVLRERFAHADTDGYDYFCFDKNVHSGHDIYFQRMNICPPIFPTTSRHPLPLHQTQPIAHVCA